MDCIFLREVKVELLIGIYEWERRVPQTIQLDLDIALPHSRCSGLGRSERMRVPSPAASTIAERGRGPSVISSSDDDAMS